MNVASKIEAFEQIALHAAEEKKRETAAAMESKFKSSVDERLREDERFNRERIQNERYRIERDKNKQIVDASGSAKRSFIAQRERLTDSLFEDIKKDLYEFASSAGYLKYLTDRIKEASGSGKYEYVELTASDMHFADEIKKETGLEVGEAAENFIGGFKLFSWGKRSVSDHTFSGRLTELRAGYSLLVKEGNS